MNVNLAVTRKFWRKLHPHWIAAFVYNVDIKIHDMNTINRFNFAFVIIQQHTRLCRDKQFCSLANGA